MSALVATPGECLHGEGIDVVDWCSGVFAGCCRGSNCSLARAMDGGTSAVASLALADHFDYCSAAGQVSL